jgi:ATP-binding cassette subfamily F protein 3
MKEKKRQEMAHLTNLGFSSYDRILFEGLDLSIKKGDVIAITGKSGSGKTVILKILAGLEVPEEGKVEIYTDKERISYVPQQLEDLDIDPNITIRDLIEEARGLLSIRKTIREYEERIEKNPEEYGKISYKYGRVLESYQKLGGYTSEAEIEELIYKLGINKHGNINLNTKLTELSSGQIRKVMIVRALYSQPKLLLLDDPTSHLDIEAVKWLAEYLRKTKSAVVMASNNREFIDMCATQTVGLTDIGRVFVFNGGYSIFEKKRDEIIKAEKREAEAVVEKLRQLRETDRKFRAKQAYKRSPDMAQVGRALESRMERLEKQYENMPGSRDLFRNEKNPPNLVFQQERRSGDDVLSLNGIVKRYGDYEAINMQSCSPINIKRGEKWLIWGPNGSGKSTLVRMIFNTASQGEFIPDEGEITLGENVGLAYFSPEDFEDFIDIPKGGLLIDELTKTVKGKDMGKVASVLIFFGFSRKAIYQQKIETLSYGEKKRLALAKIMLENPNFIILDEPTGDWMPEEIKKRLASALRRFNGTLIVVSHDTEFIGLLNPDKVLQMPEGSIKIR